MPNTKILPITQSLLSYEYNKENYHKNVGGSTKTTLSFATLVSKKHIKFLKILFSYNKVNHRFTDIINMEYNYLLININLFRLT